MKLSIVSCVGERFYGLAADSAFRIPLWRHIYTWLGIVPASVANLKKHLKWGSVGMTPGGIAEMYLAGKGSAGAAATRDPGMLCSSVPVGHVADGSNAMASG
eukprot:GHRR01014344.1.p4 GENE.GHRR01014344.1~~GHRR01014344.1.p4  ORF type:complete len:102 (+),score=33.11 GHRR01014344.1:1489-1794(+)